MKAIVSAQLLLNPLMLPAGITTMLAALAWTCM